MRTDRSHAVVVLLALSCLPGSAAWAQKLDNDDKKFLSDVRPILLRDEESTYKKLKEKADRQEFQKVFWARRDPDLATPQNEFQERYEKDRAAADRDYRAGAVAGSQTDCGRVFILLGKPDAVQTEGGTIAAGARVPETWTYKDRPGHTFQGGKAEISFGEECQAPSGLQMQLERIAAALVLHPNIDYRVGPDGRLKKLVDLLPRDTAARALFKQPRQDFPVAVHVSYLKVADGGTAVVGLVQGDASGLAAAESGAGKVVNVSVAASAAGEGGQESGWTEQTVNAPVGEDGRFLASFKMGLKPGRYELKAGAVDVKSSKASLATTPIEVPDFSQEQTAADGSEKPVMSGTVIVVRQIEDVPANAPEDPADPFGAFRLSNARMIPVFPSQLRPSDTVSFFYQVYDLQVDAGGKANGTARLRILSPTRGVVTGSAETPIETSPYGTEIGPVPLKALPPGKYTAQLEATDRIAQKTIKCDAPFEILAPQQGAEKAPATP
jgi:GWxTD domain-containing protein